MGSRWKRTYWVVWTANLITSIGMMSFLPFFPNLLEEMGVRGEASIGRWSGACFAAAPLTATFSAPLWGAIGDRFGRKVMVCRAMLAIAIFVGGMGFVTTPWQLLAMRFFQGMFSGFIPPSITLVSVSAPEDRQGRIAGNLATALAIGGLCGPLLGSVLVAYLGSYQAVFFVVGSLALGSATLVWFGASEDSSKRRETDSADRKSVGAVLRTTISDLGEVLASPTLRRTAFVVFALQFGLGAVNPTLVLYVEQLFEGVRLEGSVWETLTAFVDDDGLGLRDRSIALATSLGFVVMAIANLVSLPLWGRYGDSIGYPRALMHCAVLSLLAIFVQAAAPLFLVLLAGRLLMGVGMAGIGPLAFGLAAGEASADRRGGAFGAMFSARTFAVATGGMVGGALYEPIGVRGVMLLSAALLLGTILAFRGAARAPAAA
ncbi:MAG: MFS transporter [Planctomycetota bacterium]